MFMQECKAELILAIEKSLAILGIEQTKEIINKMIDTKKQVG